MGIFSNDNGKKLKDDVGNNSLEKQKEKSIVNSVCLISKETKIKGTIETESMFQIEGVLEGDIKGENLIHVGMTGKIEGNILGKSVLVDGEIIGEIIADKVEIGQTGKVFANITSAIFIIQEGGIFEGTKKTKIDQKEDIAKLENKIEIKIEENNKLNENKEEGKILK